ncbi:hypothetical protein ACHHYP_20513 [Achlya hypogyna]|uniref:Uncharacterized protein n=1 Tax=Achlya hypogyna TaxID=1202772 RepID=A0A1V9YJZ7_ACHHY|nr:hypothetical protein ACHHYP_20513 [Achlya hypogyna]
MASQPRNRNAYQRMMQRRYKLDSLKHRAHLVATVAQLEMHIARRKAMPMVSWKDIAAELSDEVNALQQENAWLRTWLQQQAHTIELLRARFPPTSEFNLRSQLTSS